jgi:hypothetical protein
MNPPNHSIYWDLPILIVVVSLVYSATRYDGWGAIVREAARWGGRMTMFLGSIGLALYFIAWWINAGAPWWALAVAGGIAAVVLLVMFTLASRRDGPVPQPSDHGRLR